jgi:hypothetical protein
MICSLNKVMEQALLDRGEFGGMSGDDMIATDGSDRFVDLI